jgi:hypothetical protein
MKTVRFRVALLGIAIAWGPFAAGEEPDQRSLAERAEEARQKKAGKAPSKVLTNKDLRNAKGTVIVLPEPEPSSSSSTPGESRTTPTPAPAPSTAPSPAAASGSSGSTPSDPVAVQAQVQELSDRIVRYRKALQDADAELRAGGALSNERRAALTKFLEDGRKEVAQAEQALVELKARLPGAVAGP